MINVGFLIALIPQAGNGPALVQNLALHRLPVAGMRTSSFCKSIPANSLSQQKEAHLVELKVNGKTMHKLEAFQSMLDKDHDMLCEIFMLTLWGRLHLFRCTNKVSSLQKCKQYVTFQSKKKAHQLSSNRPFLNLVSKSSLIDFDPKDRLGSGFFILCLALAFYAFCSGVALLVK